MGKIGRYNYLLGRIKQLGMSRGDLAQKIGMTPQAISRRLQGRVPITVDESLAMLAAAELPLADWPKCFAADRVHRKGGDHDDD